MRYIDPEKLYKEYKSRDDIKKIINGREYVRVAASGVDRRCNKEFFMIWIDKSLNCRNGDVIEDENGNHFTIESVAIIDFIGPAPEWYYNMLNIQISIHEIDSIGEYVIVCK